MEIQDLMDENNIQGYIEGVFEESLNEDQDKWVVYDTKTKKRLPNAGKIYKDKKAAQAFADKQENAKVASDTFYFDKIQEESVNEGKIDRVVGGRPYDYVGDGRKGQAIISGPMKDREKEAIIKRAKEAGYIAKPNMGGGVTIQVESLNEDIYDKFLDDPQSPKGRAKAIISKFIKQYGEDASGMAVDRFAKQNNLKPEEKYILQYITKNDISISSKPGGPDFSALSEAMVDYDFSKEELLRVIKQLKRGASTEVGMIKAFEKALGRELTDDEIRGFKIDPSKVGRASLEERINTILEAKKKKKKEKKDPPLNKPKRGGSKAYYVYVRDPKTKKIKKVSFGSGGLRAKIKNKEARNAFAARHNCKNKKDRTKAGYWSCNLPRYAEQLGLGSKMNTFW